MAGPAKKRGSTCAGAGKCSGRWMGEDKKEGLGALQPDWAMTFMLLGAFFKFLELVVIRDGVNRYISAAVGGLMIAIGSGLVTWNSLVAIWQASKEVSALKESMHQGDKPQGDEGAAAPS